MQHTPHRDHPPAQRTGMIYPYATCDDLFCEWHTERGESNTRVKALAYSHTRETGHATFVVGGSFHYEAMPLEPPQDAPHDYQQP